MPFLSFEQFQNENFIKEFKNSKKNKNEFSKCKFFVFCSDNIILKQNKNSQSELNQDDFEFLKNECKNQSEICEFTNIFFDSETFSLNAEIIFLKENCSVQKCFKDFFEIPVRQYFFENSQEKISISAREKSILFWNKKTLFCQSCSSKLEFHKTESAKFCPKCKNVVYPRINPCIIVLISKNKGTSDEEILLLRHTYRNTQKFACLAGFMEAGESAEDCVHREVFEEVGLKVKNLCYKGSQGWPYPDQLMLAFTAEYKSGKIKLQESEIAQAKWFKRSEYKCDFLPGSVAYRLIFDLF